MSSALFRKQVLSIVRDIPRGRVLTYKQVAQKAGHPLAYRAVGSILKNNHDSQIPCHRVIKSGGELGDYNQGFIKKAQLLIAEKSNYQALPPNFFARPALKVARDLLGKVLVRSFNSSSKDKITCLITEVEAYVGEKDKACHAYKGLTPRTKVMFGPAGYWYVYFNYGMHWLLNIVAGTEGKAEAVLIRGTDIVSGPARLTKRLKIDRQFNGKPADKSSGLWIADSGFKFTASRIQRTPRIGVGYAQEWKDKLYRFIVKEN